MAFVTQSIGENWETCLLVKKVGTNVFTDKLQELFFLKLVAKHIQPRRDTRDTSCSSPFSYVIALIICTEKVVRSKHWPGEMGGHKVTAVTWQLSLSRDNYHCHVTITTVT